MGGPNVYRLEYSDGTLELKNIMGVGCIQAAVQAVYIKGQEKGVAFSTGRAH